MDSIAYISKNLVESYAISDIYTDRSYSERNVITRNLNVGTMCATTVVANIYKVDDVEPFNYLILVGVARQNPHDIYNISFDNEVEIANINANINPFITMKSYKIPNEKEFMQYLFKTIKNLYEPKLLNNYVTM